MASKEIMSVEGPIRDSKDRVITKPENQRTREVEEDGRILWIVVDC